MDISTINGKAWSKLEEKYPGAYHFLLHESLVGEYVNLKMELEMVYANGKIKVGRSLWILDRLSDLERCESIVKDAEPRLKERQERNA